ncbi:MULTISPECIES: SPOR domain-containing protein [unclassified Clostridioides]|uniref:SPOR domain-containing protein n=1 Tax=unclassified Clostridioides TaxID=2635829 RepID=UPI001D116337|nr:SPOR domain-containing protein [Clostridioides sp. ZZV15-6388]MCC0670248.1 SPOR domain-containing protein [Clostridioides sp. ZZV14-6153]MCC0721287.1 SPOR domain-containing protein [Clostridioides sp. ZZV14-6104]MCC0740723.1 SPOR domain-containing protein [Clostridioides sp. ZZV14-5902]MCC0740905.1 SPOR domain-containing protein [Clostridioides sp. ZZV14-6044]MCC0752836.1 SPOR domain-containing protein [Clostridioides sp. ZZV13-5731]
MKVLSENNIIRNTVLNVTASFLKQESKINEKLEGVLEKKFEKVEFNEAKYAELLKFNILFYKTLARNTEPLIGKWIVDKYIPEIDELEKDLELTTAKCRKYVNKAMKDGLDCLKANDLSSFLAYDKMDLSERRRRLEKDYKVLNLYKDLLNITLRKISLEKKDCASLFLKNQADAKRELKREIIFCVNKILASSKEVVPKNIEESSEQSSEDIKATEIEDLQLGKDNSENDVLLNSVKKSELGKEPQINDVEAKFMDKLNSLNDESISQTVYNEYKKLCGLEELPYVEGYGFGREVIKDFVCATVALEFLKRRNRDLIEGAMRLTIIGEFGAENFKEFIDYVIKNKTEISEDVWEEAHVVLKDKSSELENHDIVSKRTRKNKDIDIEEYIYMIKNADKDVCFRSSISIEEDTKEEDAKEDVINKNDNIENVLENKENIEKEHDVNEEEIIESENKKSRKKDKLFGFMKKESKKEEVVEVTEKEEISLGNTSDAVTDEPNESIKDNIENLEEVNQSLEEERNIKIEKPINNNELDKKLSASNEPKSEKESKGLGDEISKEAEEKKVESEKSVVIPINKKEKNSKKSKHSPKSNSKEKKTEIKNYESNEEDFIDDEEVGSKKSRLKETIIAIVIVAIVGVGYFITVGNNKKNDKDNTPPKASTQQQANNKQTEEEKKAKAEKEKKEAEEKAKAEEKEKAEKKAKEMEAYKDGKGVYYTVYAGSLKVEATAKETAKEYEAKGISSTIVQENGYYKVKIGDYSEYGEAQEKCNELAKKSIDTYIAMYDKYYDYKLEDLKESAPSLSAEELRQKYEDLRSELRNKSGYREYVKHLDKLYEEIVEGA